MKNKRLKERNKMEMLIWSKPLCKDRKYNNEGVVRAKLPHGWLVREASRPLKTPAYVPFAADGTGWGQTDLLNYE